MHRSVLCSKFFSLIHRKGAARTRRSLSPKYLDVTCMCHPLFAFPSNEMHHVYSKLQIYVITEQQQLAVPLPLD